MPPLEEAHPMTDAIDVPHTPENVYDSSINVADVHDLKYRVHNAEQELSIEKTKLEREKRRNRRQQVRINEYIEALARSTQDWNQAMNQCQLVSNTNLALSRELEKARLTVETLEAVITTLYKASLDNQGKPIFSNGGSISN